MNSNFLSYFLTSPYRPLSYICNEIWYWTQSPFIQYQHFYYSSLHFLFYFILFFIALFIFTFLDLTVDHAPVWHIFIDHNDFLFLFNLYSLFMNGFLIHELFKYNPIQAVFHDSLHKHNLYRSLLYDPFLPSIFCNFLNHPGSLCLFNIIIS